MVTLIILVANAIAVKCIGGNCFQIDYQSALEFIAIAGFELALEIRGFIKIFKNK